jgi:hypothetical protein
MAGYFTGSVVQTRAPAVRPAGGVTRATLRGAGVTGTEWTTPSTGARPALDYPTLRRGLVIIPSASQRRVQGAVTLSPRGTIHITTSSFGVNSAAGGAFYSIREEGRGQSES